MQMKKPRLRVVRKVTPCPLAEKWQSQVSHDRIDDKARPVLPPMEQQAQVSLPAPPSYDAILHPCPGLSRLRQKQSP